MGLGVLKTLGVLALVGADPVGVGLIVVGLALLIFGATRARAEQAQGRPGPAARLRAGDEDADTTLVNRVRAELVEIINEGNALSPSAFQPPRYGPYMVWVTKTETFLETLFGELEKQRFGEPFEPPPDSLERNLRDRLRRLADLRDRADTWEVRVDDARLTAARAERRSLSEGDRIVMVQREDTLLREGAPVDAPPLNLHRTLTRLVRQGTELMNEALMAGNEAERLFHREPQALTELSTAGFRGREAKWVDAVEEALADRPADLQRFSEAHGIPASGHYAVANRLQARLAVLREIRDALGAVG